MESAGGGGGMTIKSDNFSASMNQRSEIVNGVVEVEAPKDEAPEADAPTEEGKEAGSLPFHAGPV